MQSTLSFEQHLEEIHKAGVSIRNAKQSGASRNQLLNEIFQLLYHKFYYCLYSPVPVTSPELLVPISPPRVIKVRFRVKNPEKPKETLRFQRQWENRITLSGAEVIQAVKELCAAKLSAIHTKGEFFKLELISELFNEDEQQLSLESNAEPIKPKNRKTKRAFILITENSVLRMPLRTPGPILCEVGVFDLRVTWKVPISHNRPFIRAPLIDGGVNFFDKSFSDTLAQNIDDAVESGVSQMLSLSVNIETSKFNILLAKRRPGCLFATVGIHPTYVKDYPRDQADQLTSQLNDLLTDSQSYEFSKENPLVVAVGECGLDYKSDVPKEDQILFFEKQLELATRVNLPIILHEREAFSDTIALLEKFRGKGLRGIVNCFNGTVAQMNAYIDLGFFLGVTGLICNDNRAAELLDVVKQIPLDKLVIGSDAPYLTPFNMPKPFPKHNIPDTLGYVVLKLEELLGADADQIAAASTKNIRTLLNLPVPPESLEFSAEICKENANVRVPYNSNKKALLFGALIKGDIIEEETPAPRKEKKPKPEGSRDAPPRRGRGGGRGRGRGRGRR